MPKLNGGIDVKDAATCQILCKLLVSCKVWTYYVASGGCWLQGITGKMPPREAVPGVWSGPADCPVVVMDAASDSDEVAVPAIPAVAAAREVDPLAVVPMPGAEAPRSSWQEGLPIAVILAGMAAAALVAGVAVSPWFFRRRRISRGASLVDEDASPSSARSPGSPHSTVSWVQDGSPRCDSAQDLENCDVRIVTTEDLENCGVDMADVWSQERRQRRNAVPSPDVRALTAVHVTPRLTPGAASPAWVQGASALATPSEPVQTSASITPVPNGQLRVVRDLFDILDKNGDGVITRDEFTLYG